MPQLKIQKITVLLMKDNVGSFRDALREPRSLRSIAIHDGAFDGEFWYGTPQQKPPGWIPFIAPVLASPLNGLMNSSVSAVLFVREAGRIFAVTFGYGRNLLKADCFVLDFGLRATLNRVNQNELRSLDLRTYEDLVLSTRRQVSRSSELGAFGLDVSRDLLRAVTGEPSDTQFAKRLSGADSLSVNASVHAKDLGRKCAELYAAYNDDQYKNHFDWIDHLSEVRDEAIINGLNSKLLDAIKARETERLHLAAPEALDWQGVEKFKIHGAGRVEFDDLDIDEYLQGLDERLQDLTIEKLKSYRVLVKFTGAEIFAAKWSLYKCIVWEIDEGERVYALVEGKWYEIEHTFAGRIKRYIRDIPSPSVALPPAKAGESEGQYNDRVSKTSPDLVCLDCCEVKPEDAASRIEFCDILSKQKQFIHVKKKTRSSTLSHLFAQGTVAARSFLQDGTVRDEVLKHLEQKGARGFKSVIPNGQSKVSANGYEVAFAVIVRQNGKRRPSLPFFSQLNLMQNAKLLRSLGYNVTLQMVSVN